MSWNVMIFCLGVALSIHCTGPFESLSFYKLMLLVDLRQFSYILSIDIFPALHFPPSFWNCIIGYLYMHILSNFFPLLFFICPFMLYLEWHPHINLQTFLLALFFLFLLSYISYPRSILAFSTLFFIVLCFFCYAISSISQLLLQF